MFFQFGNTALHIATASLQIKLVGILLEAHADATSLKNVDGKTPVDLAKDMGDGLWIFCFRFLGSRYVYVSRGPTSRAICFFA